MTMCSAFSTFPDMVYGNASIHKDQRMHESFLEWWTEAARLAAAVRKGRELEKKSRKRLPEISSYWQSGEFAMLYL